MPLRAWALAAALALLAGATAAQDAPITRRATFELEGAFNEAPASGSDGWQKNYPGLGPPAFLPPGEAAGPLSAACNKWSWTRYARVGRAVDLQVRAPGALPLPAMHRGAPTDAPLRPLRTPLPP